MSRLRACVLGATGIVGQHFIRILCKHPNFEISGFVGSRDSEGKLYEEAVDWIVTKEIPENIAMIPISSIDTDGLQRADYDIFFSALPSDVAYTVESDLANHGYPIFSNASAHRKSKGVPILIPEINSEHLRLIKSQPYDSGFIVTNSNCSTSGLVFGLKPLQKYGIDEVLLTTFQAVSGAGRRGVASMDILGNVIPYIRSEEEKIESETRTILGNFTDDYIKPAEFSVNASCARVPVMDGHLESISVKLDRDVSVDETIEAFTSFSGPFQGLQLPTAPQSPIHVIQDEDRPQPLRDLSYHNADQGMSVKIGRIRKKGDWLNFFLLVHNTIRGAAGASVLNAEFALANGLIESNLEVIA